MPVAPFYATKPTIDMTRGCIKSLAGLMIKLEAG
jgi:hypothetical protein